jgi:hypothetical protein
MFVLPVIGCDVPQKAEVHAPFHCKALKPSLEISCSHHKTSLYYGDIRRSGDSINIALGLIMAMNTRKTGQIPASSWL